MGAPPFLTFASVLHIDAEEACFACSLTHAQCEQLTKSLRTVATRCENEGAGRDVRLRRLWPFYKVFSENELASRLCYARHPGRPPFNRRTLMSLPRAKRWKSQAADIIQEALNNYMDHDEDIQRAFDTVLPAAAGINQRREELGEVCMEWKHWVTLLSSFRIIARTHPLYRRTYMYEGPTV